MFEKALAEKIKRIFDLNKVRFDLPSDSKEQECIFIEIVNSKNVIKENKQIARVTGKLHIFANFEKLPYGYFSKQINKADPELTKDLFFFDFEENKGTIQNITERTLSFVFLFSGQYNPELGTITSINFETQVAE